MPHYQTNPLTGLPELLKSFYRLGLHEKYIVIEEMEIQGLLTPDLQISIANALLQHSPDEVKRDVPCRGIRRLPPEAKLADIRYKLSHHHDLGSLCLILTEDPLRNADTSP